MSGQSGKASWKSWNVRHFLSNRRARSWQNCGVEDSLSTWGCFEKTSQGAGKPECQWARAPKVLVGKNRSGRRKVWVFGPKTEGRYQRAVSGCPGGPLEREGGGCSWRWGSRGLVPVPKEELSRTRQKPGTRACLY